MGKENKTGKPLIHCITNPIAMNLSANAVLALGARPIMAEHPLEIPEITETADALLLNFGNISDVKMQAMRIAIDVANVRNIPVVVDAVGVGCSTLRADFFRKLLEKNTCDVIKGNYSEIYSLNHREYKCSGIDSDQTITERDAENAALQLSGKYHSIVLATGKEDVIAFEDQVFRVGGGTPQLSTVTGTGCMLGAIIASALAFENSVFSVEKACRFFKKCGAKAETDQGCGTFMTNLLDAIGEKDEF